MTTEEKVADALEAMAVGFRQVADGLDDLAEIILPVAEREYDDD